MMSLMPDRELRGRAVQERRTALGIYSVAEFARRTGKSRDTLSAAEAGRASEPTYLELERWLEEAERQAPAAEIDGHSIRFEVTGPTTKWQVRITGPVEEADALRHQVAELIREIDVAEEV